MAGTVESPVKPVSELENEFAAETIDAGKTNTKNPNATRNRKLLVNMSDFSRQTRKRNSSPNPVHRVHRRLHGIHNRQLLPTPLFWQWLLFAATIQETEFSFRLASRNQHAAQRRKHRVTAIGALQRGDINR